MSLRLAIPRKRPGSLRGLGEALRGLGADSARGIAAERRFAAAFARYVDAQHAVTVTGARAGIYALLRSSPSATALARSSTPR